MKKQDTTKARQLRLARETVRRLDLAPSQLGDVVGGLGPVPSQRYTCTCQVTPGPSFQCPTALNCTIG